MLCKIDVLYIIIVKMLLIYLICIHLLSCNIGISISSIRITYFIINRVQKFNTLLKLKWINLWSLKFIFNFFIDILLFEIIYNRPKLSKMWLNVKKIYCFTHTHSQFHDAKIYLNMSLSNHCSCDKRLW